ncbi:hypothetical protein M153_2971000593 [Pseudoloma neurophilia]|uniref:Transposase Tc1-like domain-containing protein n=1 Tax=Pseudoloma neurophilia TaxID=146866 RepID=A0A0R0M172_9MICR|nr:hypothetical protein M153_2971000593 [Pseudoloma neurophilia]
MKNNSLFKNTQSREALANINKISLVLKGQIIEKKRNKISSEKIPEDLKVSRATVNRVWALHREKKSLERRYSPGRPKKCSTKTSNMIINISRNNSFLNPRQISIELREKTGIELSRQIIRRTLTENGIFPRSKIKRPKLTKKHKKKEKL